MFSKVFGVLLKVLFSITASGVAWDMLKPMLIWTQNPNPSIRAGGGVSILFLLFVYAWFLFRIWMATIVVTIDLELKGKHDRKKDEVS